MFRQTQKTALIKFSFYFNSQLQGSHCETMYYTGGKKVHLQVVFSLTSTQLWKILGTQLLGERCFAVFCFTSLGQDEQAKTKAREKFRMHKTPSSLPTREPQSHPFKGLSIKTAAGLDKWCVLLLWPSFPTSCAFIGDVSLIRHAELIWVLQLVLGNSILPLAVCSPLLILAPAKQSTAPKRIQE